MVGASGGRTRVGAAAVVALALALAVPARAVEDAASRARIRELKRMELEILHAGAKAEWRRARETLEAHLQGEHGFYEAVFASLGALSDLLEESTPESPPDESPVFTSGVPLSRCAFLP